MLPKVFGGLFVATLIAVAGAPTSGFAQSSTLNQMGEWQDGEIGNSFGGVAADAMGLPGASQRLYANTHDAQMLDNGSPSVFIQAPVAPPAGYSPNYYYGGGGAGYYMGGSPAGSAVR